MIETGTANDYVDLLDRLHDFLTLTGSSFGLTYLGTGDGTLTQHSGGASSVAETFTITATGATTFTVTGSVTGALPNATVGSAYSQPQIAFLITAGATAFVSGDEFQLSTAPKWTARRKALGATVLATQGNSGSFGAQNVVDGKTETSAQYWLAESPITVPQDLEFTFPESETVAQYQMGALTSYGYTTLPKAWTLQYYSGSWVTLDTQSGHDDWTADIIKTFTISSPVAATKYRLHITELNSTNDLRLGCVRLLRSDGVDAAFGQTIWEAPGNDGDSEIIVGVHPFERQDADYFNWELAGFDGFNAAYGWRQQAGFHGRLYMPLWDGTIPYWFVADGRRVIIVAKINLQYETAYLGFLDSYFTPEQYPYPLALGGSLALGDDIPDWDETDWRWSNSGHGHNAFTHSDPGLMSPYFDETPEYGTMRLRELGGEWHRYEAQRSGSPFTPSVTGKNLIWPWCGGLDLLEPNTDGTYTLWPVMLNSRVPNTVGQLNGVRCVTGQGLTAESTVTLGAVDWLVVPNISNTERDQFLAIALD
jgi:hypothetical protein